MKSDQENSLKVIQEAIKTVECLSEAMYGVLKDSPIDKHLSWKLLSHLVDKKVDFHNALNQLRLQYEKAVDDQEGKT